MRRRNSGTLPMLPKPRNMAIGGPGLGSGFRLAGSLATFNGRKSEFHNLAAGRADLDPSARAELVRRNSELLRQVAVAEDLDPIDLTLDQAGITQCLFVDLGASIESLEIGHVDGDDHGREGHVEATLGQAALNRGLSTF